MSDANLRDLQLVSLAPWEEIRGRVETVSESDSHLEVQLRTGSKTRRLRFPSQSVEARLVRHRLSENTGCVVSVLRTGLEENPLRITVDCGASEMASRDRSAVRRGGRHE